MKLNDVLSHLEALNFIDEDNKVVICVCNGKSYKKDDQLFTCDMMVSEARHFFGGLEVILNQTRAYCFLPCNVEALNEDKIYPIKTI